MSSLPHPGRIAVRQSERTSVTSPSSPWLLLRWLGSLKIAVASFLLAIILILVGTLAQVNRDIWEVLETYFKSWLTWVDASVFFPTSWFPTLSPDSAATILCVATLVAAATKALLLYLNRAEIPRAIPLAVGTIILGTVIALSLLIGGGFHFPGGATIGAIMAVNLLSAHATRYRITADGVRFLVGVVVSAIAILFTWLVIASGHNSDGFQGEPPISWQAMWQGVKVGLTIAGLGMVAAAMFSPTTTKYVRRILGASGVLLAVTSVWLWSTGEATYLGDSGMRVLWQLILATAAGILLLLAAVLLFKQRGGVITLHLGIGLLMFGGWFVSQYDVEEQMTLREGQTLNYGQDIRSVELAVVRRNSPEFSGQDDVFAIPLTKNGHPTRFLSAGTIADGSLPFEIEIVDYEKASTVEMNRSNESLPVNAGLNQGFRIAPVRPAAGAMGSSVDLASGYFRIKDPHTNQALGTYLLSQESLMMRDGMARNFDLEQVKVGDTAYDLQLRFVRSYKPYTLELLEFRKDDYLGTTIAKNFSSRVRLSDPARNVSQEITIWMNNPRRYAGETFYQSGWNQDGAGRKYTTLQVVRNYGWMIPYVACMVTVVGMLYHFLLVLLRFLERQDRAAADATAEGELEAVLSWRVRIAVPLLTLTALALLFARLAMQPTPQPDAYNLDEFGKLPLVYQGRVKPFDTLARNTLRQIADSETLNGILPAHQLKSAWPSFVQAVEVAYPEMKGEDLQPFATGDTRGLIAKIQEKTNADPYQISAFVESHLFARQPATRWLLDVITGAESLRRHRVVRIYHPQVLDLLKLDRRKYYRYSLEEIMVNYPAFEEQVQQADRVRREREDELSLYQKKVLELDRKLSMIMALHRAFSPPQFPALPTADEFQQGAHGEALQKLSAFRAAVDQQEEMFRRQPPPLAVPPDKKDQPWQAYASAWPTQIVRVQLMGEQPLPFFQALNDVMLSYLDDDVAKFNESVAAYHKLLDRERPQELVTKPTASSTFVKERFGSFYRFEADFNRWSLMTVCAYLYVLAFICGCCGWLFWTRGLNLITYWLLIGTFVVHTLALIARIYISGRPPVTNLYSSAVFIGWGVVLLGLIVEYFYRSGFANLAVAKVGFITLLIAHKLAADGDTFEVLQAVLDTQFWLATHVVCITLGYATTFLAGGLGVLYVVRGMLTTSLNRETSRELAKMIYGTLCFAILFSFFGTVLGGLWADDSWGRFWGWDPKENGALIIVLWNALILHARWDKMVGERGLAVLAMAGNIVTAWSWFGVNELGVGLHSYGFTEGRLRALGIAAAVQLFVVLIGCLPPAFWLSSRQPSRTRMELPVNSLEA